jgi:hypothetical protein
MNEIGVLNKSVFKTLMWARQSSSLDLMRLNSADGGGYGLNQAFVSILDEVRFAPSFRPITLDRGAPQS